MSVKETASNIIIEHKDLTDDEKAACIVSLEGGDDKANTIINLNKLPGQLKLHAQKIVQAAGAAGVGGGQAHPLNTDPLVDLQRLADIPNYIERAGVLDKIDQFIDYNIAGHRLSQRSKHSFLYIVNGSGIGKTWTGFHAGNHLITSARYNDYSRYRIFIDLSNGSRYDSYIDSAISVDTSLALRVAACFLGTHWKTLFLRLTGSGGLSGFTFSYVMQWFAPKVNIGQRRVLLAIHLDEIQLQPTFSQAILHIIAEFMCSTNSESLASCLNIVILPILTGTSSKDLKQKVTLYGSKHIELDPFTYEQSVAYMDSNIPNFDAASKGARFQRVLMSMGGVPRILEIFKDCIKTDITLAHLDHIIESTMMNIDTAYKIGGQWRSICHTERNLRTIIAMSISSFDVPLDHQLPDMDTSKNPPTPITIEDVTSHGIIFLKEIPSTDYFYIVYPLIVLEMLNKRFHFSSLNLMEPLNQHWGWKKFEVFEAEIDLLKNNAHFDAGWRQCSIKSYYTDCPIGDRVFMLSHMASVHKEAKHFLKKETAQPRGQGTGQSKCRHKSL
ncbi:hypothetical protein SAMD00019534_078310 [Acytostelium subglobosum LB1]|uniref:hypothetical protein n=1 Tax=Acytostelium subglobosum LB1 TaxID=1410327 RepID=UPI000644EF80|nr:hypothetical protein SAMD00019534_078310 [Acytostelium subglobosum LB1]GAM24656.1 hypothetical protein SAMD00019534_078310 [Acytostelium subglobosum LB1]|eukprot:XP_012752325.1 hypothetical protein SAMD00019534_078310 [Acytostelium subglobosum LB1]